MRQSGIHILAFLFCTSFLINAEQDECMHDILASVLTPSGERVIFDADGDATVVVMTYDENNLPCYRAYPFGNITTSGSYRVATKVTAQVVITVSNVTLDLYGNTITGGIVINSGLSNITIKNGTVDATGANVDGITVSTGCSRITISGMKIRNAAVRAIGCTGVLDSFIRNCELTQSVTGIELNTCRNIIVENCVASRNSQTGFGMLLSTTCAFLSCQALSTGDGNNAVINNNVFGFFSQNGSANIFNSCIANATQALSTTDYNSIVAGFALTGTERCAQIINCEASHAATSASGVTVPYGIYLQAQFSGLVTVTTQSTGSANDSVSALSWSPDAAFLAVGGTLAGNDLLILQTIPATLPLNINQISSVQIASLSLGSTATVFVAQWSPSGGEIMVAGDLAGNDLQVYSFNRSNFTLTLLSSVNVGATTDVVYAAAWSPNGQYLAVGGNLTTNDLRIYQFDRVALTLTQIISVNVSGTSDIVQTVAWSPNGQYLAVGGTLTGNDLQLYSFNASVPALTLLTSVNSGSPVLATAWSPDGQYLAVGGALTGNKFAIYQLIVSGSSTSLALITSAIGSTSVYSLAWSADGRFIAVGGLFTGNDLNIYNFDRGAGILNLLQSFSPSGTGNDTVQTLAWSPDGHYLAAGGTFNPTVDLSIYGALTFPSLNCIMNNTTYCSAGGTNSGVGISGSSICNIVIQNTAFANPISPTFASTSYQFVCNVFNQLFNDAPTTVQNLVMNYVQPIAQPVSIELLSQQALSLTAYIQSKIAFVYHSKFG